LEGDPGWSPTIARPGGGLGGLPGLLIVVGLLAGCSQSADPADDGTTTTRDMATTTITTETDRETTTSAETATSAPRFFTEDTPEGTYSMELEDSSTMRLPSDAPPPDVSGTSVMVLEVAYVTNPGYKEWELRAVEVGKTSITIETGSASLTWTLAVTD
jgi:predicted secreted protein